MEHKIFVINPGSTSTKMAYFIGRSCLYENVIKHEPNELRSFKSASEQFEYRLRTIEAEYERLVRNFGEADAFAGRGGLLKPLKGGTYIVGSEMLEDLVNSRNGDHASNLGAIIAYHLANKNSKNAYIVNPVTVDEMMDLARITGHTLIKRKSAFHALNQKAAAIRASDEIGKRYEESNFIVAHLGGGITVGAHKLGKVVDVNNGIEEGPFSPERAGSLPTLQLVDICFSGTYSKEQIKKMLVGEGGMTAYFGTTDCVKIIERAEKDKDVKNVLDAMIYFISKEICANAAALFGVIDSVIITGGLAKSNYIVNGIKERVCFLGKVIVYPGEDEMAALAEGVARVLDGTENPLEYGKEVSCDQKS